MIGGECPCVGYNSESSAVLGSVKRLTGYKIAGDDGDIGRIRDFYFDDDTWTVRYVVADTGKWIPDRGVVISPDKIGQPDHNRQALPVTLSRKRIEQGPIIPQGLPISRSDESKLSKHFGWISYWPNAKEKPPSAVPIPVKSGNGNGCETDGFQLRSAHGMIGYALEARDGQVGSVADLLMETADWGVCYIVVDVQNWMEGEQLLLAPHWLNSVCWKTGQCRVGASRCQVENSPRHESSVRICREYEICLCEYYNRLRSQRS